MSALPEEQPSPPYHSRLPHLAENFPSKGYFQRAGKNGQWKPALMVSWTGIRNLDRTERVLAPNMQAERLTGDISNFALDMLPEYYWTRLSALNL